MITGLKASGKDTMGDYLVNHYGYKKTDSMDCFTPLTFKQWYLRQPEGNYVVCDWRFPNEKDVLSDVENVTCIKILNDRVKCNDVHVSELFIPKLKADYAIFNNGTFEDYYNNIDMTLNIMNKRRINNE